MRGAVLFIALVALQPALADSDLPPAYWANRQLPDARQEAEAQALMGEPTDAAPDALRAHVQALKQIEDQLESA